MQFMYKCLNLGGIPWTLFRISGGVNGKSKIETAKDKTSFQK
jgi:hypothetical protein